MAVIISMLRGINVGGSKIIKMDALRAVYASLGFRDVASYVQSGNVVFRAQERRVANVSQRLEDAIVHAFGFRPLVIVRTAAEMRSVVARNPYADRADVDPSRLLITFLASDPGKEAAAKFRELVTAPDEVHVEGLEVFSHYPNGISQTKLTPALLEKTLKTPGTGRNWNTVRKLLEMAEAIEPTGA